VNDQPLKISIALCTYNGAAYLDRQLASIAGQDCLPDELVVCDDGSSDETPAIVRRFAEHAPLTVRVEINEENLGVAGNFARAIGLCQGDLIMLADQDDVWRKNKVRRLKQRFEQGPAIAFAFSDAVLVDEHESPLDDTLWDALQFSARERKRMPEGQAFDVLLQRNFVTGATMAFRSDFKDVLLPIPAGWIHDGWIAILLSALAPCELISEPLIEYRQHAHQQIGGQTLTFFRQLQIAKQQDSEYFRKIADNFTLVRDRLGQFRPRLLDERCLTVLDEKVRHFQAKTRMREPGTWRWPTILQELLTGRYRRYSLGWKSVAQDVFL
jgi:glycosyltransferase involved in cell wall biosynthesis